MVSYLRKIIRSLLWIFSFFATCIAINAQTLDKFGSPTAESILNNTWQWPTFTKAISFTADSTGFAFKHLGIAPAYGVHPRILFGPDDIPEIRKRIANTDTGQRLLQNLKKRTQCLYKSENWEFKLLEKLHIGNLKAAQAILDSNPKPNGTPGHYQPYIIYEIVLDAFDALVHSDEKRANYLSTVFYNYTRLARPKVEQAFKESLFPDNVWLSGAKEAMDYQFIAYGYDFLYNYMSKKQQNFVRELIAYSTYGKITVGMEIPPHFRNWNWVMVGSSLMLNVLAIEGEKGYDDRVYTKSVEVLKDYLTYAISKKGVSTEAVGYTGFGFYWGAPALLAMARKGDNLLTHPHYRAMKDWYLYTLAPFGYRWNSHGDGGMAGPSMTQMQLMKYFYPDDSQVDYLWKNTLKENHKDKLEQKQNLLISLICATDGKDMTGDEFIQKLAAEKKPLTFYDKDRGSLIIRNQWSKEATSLQVEGRTDGVVISHEHADRGSFSFASHGRMWSPDGFRSMEAKYHNTILVNGRGQSALPIKWLAYHDKPEATFSVMDLSHAFNYSWLRDLFVEWIVNDPRLKEGTYYGNKFRKEVFDFKENHQVETLEHDTLPHLTAFFEDFQKGNPKIWGGESGWPYRLENTPVRHAYRTIGMVKGAKPYVLISDDIEKDGTENLYEWLMMVEPDLSIYTMVDNDILLCDQEQIAYYQQGFNLATKKVDDGTPMLLVRIIAMNLPEDYSSNPSVRLEILEKFDTYNGERGRTFGLGKRLVIPTKSIRPDFKIMLFPHKAGDALPVTSWNEKTGVLEVKIAGEVDSFTFEESSTSSTIEYRKNGKKIF